FTQRNIEQMTDTRRQTFEKPDMRTRACQFDMTETFAAYFRLCHFNAALIADHASMLHALVFAAETFPVGHRTEHFDAEKPIAFRLKGTVIDGLRLGDFAMRPRKYLFRRGKTDTNCLKIRREICFFLCSKHSPSEASLVSLASLASLVSRES